MSAAITSLFNATTGAGSAAGATWKATTPPSTDGVWKAAGGAPAPAMTSLAKLKAAEDHVEVSGLAKSLTGVAGEVFASLGSKARTMLEGFVKSKQMTEDEVALGLRSMATDAVFGRYMRERPRDDEDKAWEAKGKLLEQAFHRKMERTEKAMSTWERGTDAALAAFADDQDQEALHAVLKPLGEQLRAETADIAKEERETVGGDPNELNAAMINHFLGKGIEGFKKLNFGDEENGLLPLFDEKGRDAAGKLWDLGFTPHIYRNGLSDFAASVDIPGIGSGTAETPLPESEPSAAQEAAAAGGVASAQRDATATPPGTPAAAPAETAAVKKTISVLTAVIPPEARSFSMVTSEARKSLDSAYGAMSKAGVTTNFRNGRPEDVENFLAGFDRRSLYAIASDSEGKFTKTEQEAARTVMSRQQAEAMAKADPTGANPAAGQSAAIAFLDAASAEEKSSDLWAAQRAAARKGVDAADVGRTAVNGVTGKDDALLRMMKGALSVTV